MRTRDLRGTSEAQWTHFCHLDQDAHGTIGPITGRLSERPGYHSDLLLGEGPSFRRRPRRRANTIVGRVDAFVDHRSAKNQAVEQQCGPTLKVVGRKHPGNQWLPLKCPHLDKCYLRKIVKGCQSNRRHRVTVFDTESGVGLPEHAGPGMHSICTNACGCSIRVRPPLPVLLSVSRISVAPMTAKEHDVSAGGITLRVREVGNPGGEPVIHFHGTPGCRLELAFADDIVEAAGARVIAFDRPGYGGSTQTPFSLASVAKMAIEVADRFGMDQFRTSGWSGADRSPWPRPSWPEVGSRRSVSSLGPRRSSWFPAGWTTSLTVTRPPRSCFPEISKPPASGSPRGSI